MLPPSRGQFALLQPLPRPSMRCIVSGQCYLRNYPLFLSLVSVIPPVIAGLALQRYVTHSLTLGAVK